MTAISATDPAALHVMLGGTFDPVHNGHLRVAVDLRELLGEAVIHLVPCQLPPHRETPGTSAEARMRMVEVAVEGEPGLLADDRELKRPGPSYSVDTLAGLREQAGAEAPLAMALGADAYAGIESWHHPRRLLELAHIIVVARPGYQVPPDSLAGRWLRDHGASDAADLRRTPAGRVLFLRLSWLEISATDIRRRVAEGRSPRYLVPDAVWHLIRSRQLYQSAESNPTEQRNRQGSYAGR